MTEALRAREDIRAVGEGAAWIEGKDLVVFEWVGTIGAQETATVMEWCHDLHARVGTVFLLLDMTRATNVEASGRSQMIRYARSRPLTGAALVGARNHLRTVVTMVIRALDMFRQTEQRFHFAQSEHDARNWLSNLRASTGAPR